MDSLPERRGGALVTLVALIELVALVAGQGTSALTREAPSYW